MTGGADVEDIRVLQGDVREGLAGLPAESVHVCVTSPPYWSLRDYGTASWEGGSETCDHRKVSDAAAAVATSTLEGGKKATGHLQEGYKSVCGKCGARRIDKQLGLEPTPEEHVAAMVAVFREVRRVLRPDGLLFVNYGDCYVAGPSGSRGKYARGEEGDGAFKRLYDRNVVEGVQPAEVKASRRGSRSPRPKYEGDCGTDQKGPNNGACGLTEKNLVGMPFRVALGLQADGWIWRSCMPWLKRSAMPDSVKDRPGTGVEYVLMFSKRPRYFWDQEAVRRESTSGDRPQPSPQDKTKRPNDTPWHNNQYALGATGYGVNPNGRGFRNSDLFFDSIDHAVDAAFARWQRLRALQTACGLVCEGGDPLALLVNTQPLGEGHYAAYPEKLIEPLILAGTSEAGVCCQCGAPWKRLVEKSHYSSTYGDSLKPDVSGSNDQKERSDQFQTSAYPERKRLVVETKGWQKGCKCPGEVRQPAVVLDPFSGSGTTLRVARRLGRRAIGIELSPEYVSISERRTDITPALPGLFP